MAHPHTHFVHRTTQHGAESTYTLLQPAGSRLRFADAGDGAAPAAPRLLLGLAPTALVSDHGSFPPATCTDTEVAEARVEEIVDPGPEFPGEGAGGGVGVGVGAWPVSASVRESGGEARGRGCGSE